MTWWAWLILGFLLVALEVFTSGFVILWFGIGAILISLLTALSLVSDAGWQIVMWSLSSILMAVLWFRFYKKDNHVTHSGRASSDVVGENGIMTKAIEPFQMGRVRFQKPILGSDEWECLSDSNLAHGERVKVLSVEGNYLKVAATKKAHSEH